MKLVVCLLMLFNLCACGSLVNCHRQRQAIMLTKTQTYAIQTSHCNTNECLHTPETLHQTLSASIEQTLKKHGLTPAPLPASADYQLRLISVYEEKIALEHPRNVYLIILDKAGIELAQFGMGEAFSTPLVAPYTDQAAFTAAFTRTLDGVFSSPDTVAQSQ